MYVLFLLQISTGFRGFVFVDCILFAAHFTFHAERSMEEVRWEDQLP